MAQAPLRHQAVDRLPVECNKVFVAESGRLSERVVPKLDKLDRRSSNDPAHLRVSPVTQSSRLGRDLLVKRLSCGAHSRSRIQLRCLHALEEARPNPKFDPSKCTAIWVCAANLAAPGDAVLRNIELVARSHTRRRARRVHVRQRRGTIKCVKVWTHVCRKASPARQRINSRSFRNVASAHRVQVSVSSSRRQKHRTFSTVNPALSAVKRVLSYQISNEVVMRSVECHAEANAVKARLLVAYGRALLLSSVVCPYQSNVLRRRCRNRESTVSLIPELVTADGNRHDRSRERRVRRRRRGRRGRRSGRRLKSFSVRNTSSQTVRKGLAERRRHHRPHNVFCQTLCMRWHRWGQQRKRRRWRRRGRRRQRRRTWRRRLRRRRRRRTERHPHFLH